MPLTTVIKINNKEKERDYRNPKIAYKVIIITYIKLYKVP